MRICLANKVPGSGSRDYQGPHLESHCLNRRAKMCTARRKHSPGGSTLQAESSEVSVQREEKANAGPCAPRCVFPPAVPLCYGRDIRLEEPRCWALSARPTHSRVSSDSILMIKGRVWSQAANRVASREVLPLGSGLEKLKWEL